MTHDPGLPPVVRAKLTQPRALPSRVRPTTLDHACTALAGRLTLVCAPGGYGKTTLALEALRKTGLPAAWYRVDELDRDPVVFLASVTEAIAARVPAFGELIRDRLRSASQGQVSNAQLAAIFVNDLAEHLSTPLNLVIDDYHEAIDSPGLNSTLEYLMAAAPEVLRFVVLSRYEPAFAVSKMQLAGEVARFGVEQLRLTGRETRLLVKDRGGVVLDEASSERLAQLTQGWPASIALAAMTLQWMDFPSIEAAVSDPRLTRDVYGYLTEQVYSREKPTTRAFLLDTCCLEYVTPELADDVAGRQDGHAQLEHLTGNQVFTARAEDEKTCRYHPLLRDFLRQRFLQERGAGAYHALQVRSAQAMERAGDLPSAIAIYLSANEGQEALDVIARADYGTLEDIRSDTLQAWLSRLPAALRTEPWALVLQAHLLMRSGKYEESVGCASGALATFERMKDRAGRYQALCVKECALFWKGDNEGAREASQGALDVAQTAEERIHALISLAAACEGQCRWDEALESLESAASLAGQTNRGEGFRVASHRATISYLTGRLREAAAQFEQATRIENDGSSLGLRVAVMNAHGLTFMGLGLYQNAASKFDNGVEIARAQGYDFYAAMLASSVSQLKLANGIADTALGLAGFATTSGLLDEDAFCLSYAFSHLGTIHRRTGDLERASNAYQRAVEVADEGSSTHALLNASANLAFTRFPEAQRSCRRQLHTARSAATEKGLLFLAAKASFYLAVADYSQGEHQRAFEGLRRWAAQAIRFGPHRLHVSRARASARCHGALPFTGA